jgi:hypothetical protein
LGLLGNRIVRSEKFRKRGPLSATRTTDAMSIAENKKDCVPGLVPADGTMLPIGENGDFGRSPFLGQLTSQATGLNQLRGVSGAKHNRGQEINPE